MPSSLVILIPELDEGMETEEGSLEIQLRLRQVWQVRDQSEEMGKLGQNPWGLRPFESNWYEIIK